MTGVRLRCTTNTYSVGGQISGLIGNGLELSDGEETTSPTASATAFTFPTALVSGAQYQVSVINQPAGQTCVINNGVGSVQSGNVATITVSCASSGYLIGGTISGLRGTGLVLATGISTVAPSATATSFLFPTGLATGDSYVVSVQTQPAGQTCVITNATGTIATSNVTNVAVACGAPAYTVGGSIAGLAGGGLVLQDNGGDDLFVAAGASSFVFQTSLASGAPFEITVMTNQRASRAAFRTARAQLPPAT